MKTEPSTMHRTTVPRPSSAPTDHSLLGLIDRLREDVRTLVHDEVQLAKTELGEKVSYFGRNAMYLAIGGIVAYLGLIFLLISIGFLIASGFETLGLSTAMALFLGFLAIAVVAAVIGGAMAGKALAAFKKQSLAPKKTIETLQQIKEGGIEQAEVKIYRKPSPPPDTRNSDQIKSEIEHTRGRINEDVTGIKRRLAWGTMAVNMVAHVKSHPMRSASIGLGTGVVGYALMRVARLFGRRRAV